MCPGAGSAEEIRRFLSRRLGLVVLAVAAVLVAVTARFMLWDSWVFAGSAKHIRQDRVIYVPNRNTFVVFNDSRFQSFLGLSPHIPGERVYYCLAGGYFEGLHGEKFDRNGNYITGPGARGLDRLQTRAITGLVFFDAGRVLKGLPRFTQEAEHPTRYLSCENVGPPDGVVEDPPGFWTKP